VCTLIPTHILVSYAMMLVLYSVFVQTLMATVYSLHGTEVGIYIGFTLRSLNSVHCLSESLADTNTLESHGINQRLEVRRLGNVIRQSSLPTLIPDPSLVLHYQHSRQKGRRRT
jgi:hypothetical protein